MKPITLNLASRPFRNNVVVGTVVGVTATALVLATVYNLYLFLSYGSSYAQLQHDQAADRVHIAELQKEEQRLAGEIKKRDFRHTYERGKIAHDLILKHSFSWTRLFNTLEAVVPPDVVMTAIRPNVAAEGIVVRIEGVAKSHGALLNLETQLQGNAAFARVYPLNERRLNPSLPDITFLLTFNYLPHRTAPADLVAAGNPGAAAPAAGSAVESSAAPDAGTAGDAAPVGAPGGAPVDTAGGVPAKPPTAGAPGTRTVIAAAGKVGRDGLLWERRAASGPAIAPGGIASPSASVAKPTVSKKGKGSKPPVLDPEAAKKGQAEPPAVPPANSAAAASHPAMKPAPAKPAPAKSSSTNSAPAIPAPATATMRPIPSPPRADPNARHVRPQGTGTPLQAQSAAQAAAQAQATRPPTAAQRLDVPLSFVGRPVAEVYQRLAEAHGVRFELDEAIDREARITVNLKGRNLEDAILLVSGLTHQQVRRLADGVYRVAPLDAAAPIADPPVDEESIAPQEAP